MPLVNTREMFKKAYEGGYAIGAFNVNNMEIVQGITEACKELQAPVILQVSAGARKYANHTYLTKLVEAAVEETGVPIALHLDHGNSFELCKSCIDGGFTSVMFDGSHLPYEENVAVAKQVAEYAHQFDVTVEAELGQLAERCIRDSYKTYYTAYSIRLPEGTADTYRIFPASDYEPSACIRTGDEISFTYYKDQKGDLVIDEYHCPQAEQRLQAWIDAQSDETLQKAGLK